MSTPSAQPGSVDSTRAVCRVVTYRLRRRHGPAGPHGLVRQPADWPDSSFHRDVRLGWVPVGWQGREVGIDAGERAAVW